MSESSTPNEKERLRTLRLYRVLDTAAERSLDDLTRLAAAICDTPISLISLVDEDRQWFKSRFGLTATETPRIVSFCAHAILQEDMFVVEDACVDERFAQNPLVTDDPSIRFYAGAPLTMADGLALGTLCVIDRQPRTLSDFQSDALRVLRDAVTTQLELTRSLADLRDLERLLPMCGWCHSIRNEKGTWLPLREYVGESSQITHGICPACSKQIDAP